MSDDPYWDEENNLLRNKLGVTDQDRLQRQEGLITAAAIQDIQDNPIPGKYDEAHFNKFHETIFEDVYDWAGEPRTQTGWWGEKPEDVLNMQSVEYPTVYGEDGRVSLQESLDDIFSKLAADDNLKNLTPSEFVAQISDLTTELWKAHSFREGNTRSTTTFIKQLCKDAGHELPQEFPEQRGVFRDTLALASSGFKTELNEQFRAAVMPIELSENNINQKEAQLVENALADKPIDFDINKSNTASEKYIDSALNQLTESRNQIAAQLRAELPHDFERLELQDRLDTESLLFEKFVELTSEQTEIDLALTAHSIGEQINIDGLKERHNDITREMLSDKKLDTDLTFERKEEGMLRVQSFRQALQFNDIPILNNGGERAHHKSQGARIDIPADRAKRSLDHTRSMLNKSLTNDLDNRIKRLENPQAKKQLKTAISNESEKRSIISRRAVNESQPTNVSLVNKRINRDTVAAHLKEINTLDKNSANIINDAPGAESKLRSNDHRVQYLTNKLNNTPALSKYLSASDKTSISKAQSSSKERSSRSRGAELER